MLNLDNTSALTLGMAVSVNRLKLGPNGPGGGAAIPWLGPNMSIFGGSPIVSIVTWPMVVLRAVEVICFGFGLVLLIFGPLVLHSSSLLFLGCVGWHLRFVSLRIPSVLYAFPSMSCK